MQESRRLRSLFYSHFLHVSLTAWSCSSSSIITSIQQNIGHSSSLRLINHEAGLLYFTFRKNPSLTLQPEAPENNTIYNKCASQRVPVTEKKM